MPKRGASRAWSLLTLLLVYGVLAILPMLVAGGYLLLRVAQAERVQLELVPYTGRVSIDGPLVMVEGVHAQTFSLLVHELATNAAKYGALSNAAGRVSVSWSIEGEREAARLRFCWQERDGPVISEPSRKGFGSTLLQTALPVMDDRPPQLSFDPHGLVYEVDVGLAAISAT